MIRKCSYAKSISDAKGPVFVDVGDEDDAVDPIDNEGFAGDGTFGESDDDRDVDYVNDEDSCSSDEGELI